jgi:uncharacterized protein YecE (DUF72 family)
VKDVRIGCSGWVYASRAHPSGFLFAVKGSRYLTHIRRLRGIEEGVARWRRRIAAWRSRREVFAYLNNDWEEFAPPNAISLREGLSVPQLV